MAQPSEGKKSRRLSGEPALHVDHFPLLLKFDPPDKNLIMVILISWFLLSQVPQNSLRLSGKCLRGVWVLSE